MPFVAPIQQAGEFKTGEEDVIDSAEVRLRAAYKEAAIAVMTAVVPDKGHPFVKVRERGSECERRVEGKSWGRAPERAIGVEECSRAEQSRHL